MDQLKEKKLKSTKARRDIIELFETSHSLMSADEVYSKIKRKGTDLATVYRTLEVFLEKGIIRKVDVRAGADTYEIAGHHHHHIVCTECNTIESFESCEAEDISKKLLKGSKKFRTINDHSFEFFGVCKSCSKV